MSDVAIQVEGLSKRYLLGERHRSNNLREAIVNTLAAPFRRRGGAGNGPDILWALKGVSFEVKRGEVMGVIGRNGAGKSTLLKILARITEPTEGQAVINGRVGSLLEVGTGFHPELTGRENVFLNGAILGMKRAEIERKFDEIVAFSEIDMFLDTPVKRYSSGMYTRLAFAVAAHLEPEILIVDEVLAVGDAAFQKKCLGKMNEVARRGRTVLFVSHNMAAVQALCGRGLFLRGGTVAAAGPIADTVTAYLKSIEQSSRDVLSERSERAGRGQVRITRIDITPGGDGPQGRLVTGAPARFVFHLSGSAPGLICGFNVYDQFGVAVAGFHSHPPATGDAKASAGDLRIICEVEQVLLVPGHYYLNVFLTADEQLQDHLEGAASFDVEPGAVRGRPVELSSMMAKVCLPHRWVLP